MEWLGSAGKQTIKKLNVSKKELQSFVGVIKLKMKEIKQFLIASVSI